TAIDACGFEKRRQVGGEEIAADDVHLFRDPGVPHRVETPEVLVCINCHNVASWRGRISSRAKIPCPSSPIFRRVWRRGWLPGISTSAFPIPAPLHLPHPWPLSARTKNPGLLP